MKIYSEVKETGVFEEPIKEALKILEENSPTVSKGYKLDKENVFANIHPLGTLIAFPLVSNKHKGNYRRGYQMCYVVNVTNPSFSEYGDIYIDKDAEGNLYKAM